MISDRGVIKKKKNRDWKTWNFFTCLKRELHRDVSRMKLAQGRPGTGVLIIQTTSAARVERTMTRCDVTDGLISTNSTLKKLTVFALSRSSSSTECHSTQTSYRWSSTGAWMEYHSNKHDPGSTIPNSPPLFRISIKHSGQRSTKSCCRTCRSAP